MEKKTVEFKFKGKKFNVEALVLPKWAYGIGLMFKRKSKAKPLLFRCNNSNESIHSFFVNFPFYAVWMDKNFNVIEVKKVIPWKFSVNCRREFDYLLEIPIVSNLNFLPSEFRRVLERFK